MKLRTAAIVIGLVTIVRLVIAARVPLSEDEAYYWTWSRHLAWGYTDHPPAVAWLIALTSPFGQSAGVVRLPFVLCYALAALALGGAAQRISGSSRAGGTAALAFVLLPMTKIVLGEALPDGPYILCWALALWSAAAMQQEPARRRWAILLGIALGGALLSRFFGWALVGGIVAYSLGRERRVLWRDGLWLAFGVAALVYAPFVVWNATHGWQNFAFTLQQRQSIAAFSSHISPLSSMRAAIYAAAVWLVGYFVAIRPRNALVAWTALPLPAALTVLGLFTTVESYWLLGPFASLCVGIGIAVAGLPAMWRRVIAMAASLPAAYTLGTVMVLALPDNAQRPILAMHGARNLLYSGAFLYEPLAHDVAALSERAGAIPLTDRPEIAGELYYHGVPPLMIGYAPQTRPWNAWQATQRDLSLLPRTALIVSYSPVGDDAELMTYVKRLCARLEAGPTLEYRHAGAAWGAFHTSWCTRSGEPLVTEGAGARTGP